MQQQKLDSALLQRSESATSLQSGEIFAHRVRCVSDTSSYLLRYRHNTHSDTPYPFTLLPRPNTSPHVCPFLKAKLGNGICRCFRKRPRDKYLTRAQQTKRKKFPTPRWLCSELSTSGLTIAIPSGAFRGEA